MLIAQITDPHILRAGDLGCDGKIDPAARLAKAIEVLNALDPAPDVLLITGDLVEHGTVEEYSRFRDLAGDLKHPCWPVPGNHDQRTNFRAAFPDVSARADHEFVQYVVDGYAVRLIALDTLVEGRNGGRLCERRLAWLSSALEADPRPTLLFMHHPPYEIGLKPNPDMTCEGAEELDALVRRHGNVIGVICGHLHRPTLRAFGGTVASSLPGVSPTLDLNLRGGMFTGWIDTPPFIGLHVWDGRGLTSHILAANEHDDLVPFASSIRA